jgi:hypothetical protein
MMLVGYERPEVQEALYLDYICAMTDDRLEEEARDYVWLCETAPGSPWQIDTWKRDFCRDELDCRGQGRAFRRGPGPDRCRRAEAGAFGTPTIER